MARIWQQVLKIIDKRLQERQIFDSFFADTYINEIKGNTITVIVSNQTAEILLSSKYIELIKDAVNEVTDQNYEIIFEQLNDIAKRNISLRTENNRSDEPSFFKNADVKPELTFEAFVEGDFNKGSR